jgi:magnesium-transporting ATPase (P-type)
VPGDAPTPSGLTSDEAARILAASPPRKAPRSSRSLAEIIWSNTFTLFNLILILLLVPLAIFGLWGDMLFGGVLVANTAIGIFQEVRAKRTLDRLALLGAPQGRVLRDGEPVMLPVAGWIDNPGGREPIPSVVGSSMIEYCGAGKPRAAIFEL